MAAWALARAASSESSDDVPALGAVPPESGPGAARPAGAGATGATGAAGEAGVAGAAGVDGARAVDAAGEPAAPPVAGPSEPNGAAEASAAARGRPPEGPAEQVAQQALALVRERLLEGADLERVVAQVSTRAVERLRRDLGAKLEEDYLNGLPARIAREVSDDVLLRVRRHMDQEDLPHITGRITRRALESVEERLEREDLAGLAGRAEEARERLEALEARLAAEEPPEELVAGIARRVAERLGGADLPEALAERVDEHAARRTAFLVEERLGALDLPGLPDRVVEEVLGRLPGGGGGGSAAADGEASRVAERVSALEAKVGRGASSEEAVTAHVLESIWAHLERTGLRGFPDRILRDVAEQVRSGLAGRGGAGEAGAGAAAALSGDAADRLAALEERLAILDPDQLSTGVTAHVLESLWAHLEEHGLAGFPQRVGEEIVARSGAHLRPADAADPGGAALDDRVAALEERVALISAGKATAEPSPEFLEQVVQLAEEAATRASAGGGAEPASGDAALLERVARLEARLDQAGLAAAARGAEPDWAGLSQGFVDQVVQVALEAVDERSSERDVQRQTARVVEAVWPQVLEQLRGWEPEGWQEQVGAAVSAELQRRVDALDLDLVPDRAVAEALEAVSRRLDQEGTPRRLAEQAHAALEAAKAEVDIRALSERVALMATQPLMQAIDGRLNELGLEALPDELVERIVERAAEQAAERLQGERS